MIPSTDVAEPAFFLPDVLPPGAASAVVAKTRCSGLWLGLAGATSDLAGRVQAVTIKRIEMDTACDKAVTTLMRLSLATPTSLDVPMEASNILLVHGFKQPPCLDEAPLDASNGTPRDVGGEITAPTSSAARSRSSPNPRGVEWREVRWLVSFFAASFRVTVASAPCNSSGSRPIRT